MPGFLRLAQMVLRWLARHHTAEAFAYSRISGLSLVGTTSKESYERSTSIVSSFEERVRFGNFHFMNCKIPRSTLS
jgi:rhamnose utilization protein RhaD (predicted bifunctional aldolase and dehydrogenase)